MDIKFYTGGNGYVNGVAGGVPTTIDTPLNELKIIYLETNGRSYI